MIDHVDRVLAMTGNERVEHLPDLEERHALLLMASQPQGGAFTKGDIITGPRLAFHGEEPFLLDANKVCERLLAVVERFAHALCSSDASRNHNLPRHFGVAGF